MIVCNRHKTRVLKIFDIDSEFTKFENVTILESIETEEQAPIVEHVERRLLFIGGRKTMVVVDLPKKTIIARFQFKGIVKSIYLSKTDQGGIHVLSKYHDQMMSTHENYFHKITFNSVVYR